MATEYAAYWLRSINYDRGVHAQPDLIVADPDFLKKIVREQKKDPMAEVFGLSDSEEEARKRGEKKRRLSEDSDLAREVERRIAKTTRLNMVGAMGGAPSGGGQKADHVPVDTAAAQSVVNSLAKLNLISKTTFGSALGNSPAVSDAAKAKQHSKKIGGALSPGNQTGTPPLPLHLPVLIRCELNASVLGMLRAVDSLNRQEVVLSML